MSEAEPGERVRELRQALGWTQEELAKRAEMPRHDVARVENGHNQATSYAMRKSLAKGFDLSLEEVEGLLGGELDLDAVVARGAVARKVG